MGRAARLSEGLNVPFGVFDVIGIEYAPRAARAWWPTERLLMEDVSCAFQPVWTRAGAGRPVPQLQIDRLVHVLDRYLVHVGSPWAEDQLREAVARFIQVCPRDVAEDVEQDA